MYGPETGHYFIEISINYKTKDGGEYSQVLKMPEFFVEH
jgi:hypothetical protein